MLNLELRNLKLEGVEYKYIEKSKENNTVKFAYDFEKIGDELVKFTLNVICISESRADEKSIFMGVAMSSILHLESDGELSEDKVEQIVKSTGSTIIYPYIRTIFQNISGAGTIENSITLPIINIAKVIEDLENEVKK